MRELRNVLNEVITEAQASEMVLITLGADEGLYCWADDVRILTGGSFVDEVVYCDECCEVDGELFYTDDSDFIAFDEINDCYILEAEAVQCFHRGGDKYITSINHYYLIEFQGDYYTEAGCDYYGIYYCNNCDEYYCNECENCLDEANENVFDYHDQERIDHSSGSAVYKVGLEIEKDDADIKQGLNVDDKYNILERYGVILERDGSLSDEGGFEIVTPCFDFHTKTAIFKIDLIKAFEENELLNKLVSAQADADCGFHLNLSRKGFSDKRLLKQLKPVLSLLYTLYSKREFNRYCKFKAYGKLLNDEVKFQAVRLKGDYIELRLFPRVESLNQLIFRLELMRILLKYTENQVKTEVDLIRKLKNKKSLLNKHLNKVLNVNSDFIKRLRKMSLKYSDKMAVLNEASV